MSSEDAKLHSVLIQATNSPQPPQATASKQKEILQAAQAQQEAQASRPFRERATEIASKGLAFQPKTDSSLSRKKKIANVVLAPLSFPLSLVGAILRYLKDHPLQSLIFIGMVTAFLVFSMVGNKTTTFDSFNAQLIQYYTQGAIFYGSLSGIFSVFILMIGYEQSRDRKKLEDIGRDYSSDATSANEDAIKYAARHKQKEMFNKVRTAMSVGLFGLLVAMSHNLSMLIAYSNMNMDTENIPQWAFPLTVAMSMGFFLVGLIVSAISRQGGEYAIPFVQQAQQFEQAAASPGMNET